MTFWPVLYFLSISYFSFTSKVVESSRSRCLNECLYYPAEIISLLSNIIIKFFLGCMLWEILISIGDFSLVMHKDD